MSHHAPPPPLDDAAPEAPLTRRTALWLTSRLAMVAGLVGGYGLFAWVGGRFMLPAHTGRVVQRPLQSRVAYVEGQKTHGRIMTKRSEQNCGIAAWCLPEDPPPCERATASGAR